MKGYLREVVTSFRGSIPTTLQHFRSTVWQLVERGFAEAEAAGISPEAAVTVATDSAQTILVKFLQVMSRDTDRHYALRASCYLRLMGHDGRSFHEIGAEHHVTRQAVQIIYRALQRRHPDLRSRGDKSDAAREDCRRRRLGVRKIRSSWQHTRLWMNPVPLTLP